MQHLPDHLDLAKYARWQRDDDVDLRRFDIRRERLLDVARKPSGRLTDSDHVLHQRGRNLAVGPHGNRDSKIGVTPHKYLQRIARPNEVISRYGARRGRE